MLDIGWSELAIIAVVALFVIGPKELPKALRTIGRYAGQVRAIGREFQASIDEAVREAELDEVKKQIESAGKVDINKALKDTIDPKGQISEAMDIRTDEGSTAKPKTDATPTDAPAADAPPSEPEAAPTAPATPPPGGAGMSAASARAATKPAESTSPAPGAKPVPEPSAASGTGTS